MGEGGVLALLVLRSASSEGDELLASWCSGEERAQRGEEFVATVTARGSRHKMGGDPGRRWWVAPPPWGFGGAGGDEADGVGDDELVGGGEVAVGGGLLFRTTIGWPARRRGGVLRRPHCLPLATTRTPCSSSAAWREVGWEMRGEKIEG